MSKHDKFIKTPITVEIKDAIYATQSIGNGIETFSLNEYMMHSLFLRMTGFQEQKMKCIAWEMGTDDFEFRRKLLNDLNLGEYSTYKSKNTIFQELVSIINNNSGDLSTFFDKKFKDKVTGDTLSDIENLFRKSNFPVWNERKYKYFLSHGNELINSKQILISQSDKYFLFQNKGDLINYYDNELYRHRNRLAHNLTSYQENLPSLVKLKSEDDSSRNYFMYFAVLTLIDSIFIKLYEEFRKAIDEHNIY